MYQDEIRGDELEWDLSTDVQRVSLPCDQMPWPKAQLERIVQMFAP